MYISQKKHLRISIFFLQRLPYSEYYLLQLLLLITEITIKCRSKNRIQGIFITAY